jgi:hypothetical protein
MHAFRLNVLDNVCARGQFLYSEKADSKFEKMPIFSSSAAFQPLPLT